MSDPTLDALRPYYPKARKALEEWRACNPCDKEKYDLLLTKALVEMSGMMGCLKALYDMEAENES